MELNEVNNLFDTMDDWLQRDHFMDQVYIMAKFSEILVELPTYEIEIETSDIYIKLNHMKTLCVNKNTNRAWIIIDIVKDFSFFEKGLTHCAKPYFCWVWER